MPISCQGIRVGLVDQDTYPTPYSAMQRASTLPAVLPLKPGQSPVRIRKAGSPFGKISDCESSKSLASSIRRPAIQRSASWYPARLSGGSGTKRISIWSFGAICFCLCSDLFDVPECIQNNSDLPDHFCSVSHDRLWTQIAFEHLLERFQDGVRGIADPDKLSSPLIPTDLWFAH
jgi:hypothetical protein